MSRITEIIRKPVVRNFYHVLAGTELRRSLKSRIPSLGATFPFRNVSLAGYGGIPPYLKIEDGRNWPPSVMSAEMHDPTGGPSSSTGTPKSLKSTNLQATLERVLKIKESKWLIAFNYIAIISISVYPFPIISGALGIGLPLVLAAPLLHLVYHHYVRGKAKRALAEFDRLIQSPAGKEELARLIVDKKINLDQLPLKKGDKDQISALIEGIKLLKEYEELERKSQNNEAAEFPQWAVDIEKMKEKISPLLEKIPKETETYRRLSLLPYQSYINNINTILGTIYDYGNPPLALEAARRHQGELQKAIEALKNAQIEELQAIVAKAEKYLQESLNPEIDRLSEEAQRYVPPPPPEGVKISNLLADPANYSRDLEAIIYGEVDLPSQPGEIISQLMTRAKKINKESPDPQLVSLAETAMEILFEIFKNI